MRKLFGSDSTTCPSPKVTSRSPGFRLTYRCWLPQFEPCPTCEGCMSLLPKQSIRTRGLYLGAVVAGLLIVLSTAAYTQSSDPSSDTPTLGDLGFHPLRRSQRLPQRSRVQQGSGSQTAGSAASARPARRPAEEPRKYAGKSAQGRLWQRGVGSIAQTVRQALPFRSTQLAPTPGRPIGCTILPLLKSSKTSRSGPSAVRLASPDFHQT